MDNTIELSQVPQEGTATATGTVSPTSEPIPAGMYAAFAAAQAEFLPIRRNCINPLFKSHYADLGSILTSVRASLNKHGFAISWRIKTTPEQVSAAVVLYYKDGGSLESEPVVLPYFCGPKAIPAQAIGSSLTYARRYAISAFLGIATDDDDDGNAAGSPGAQPAPQAPAYELQKAELDRLDAIARKGSQAYAEEWQRLPGEERRALISSGWHKELKDRASVVDEAAKEGANA